MLTDLNPALLETNLKIESKIEGTITCILVYWGTWSLSALWDTILMLFFIVYHVLYDDLVFCFFFSLRFGFVCIADCSIGILGYCACVSLINLCTSFPFHLILPHHYNIVNSASGHVDLTSRSKQGNDWLKF